jgi:hypothetical protein
MPEQSIGCNNVVECKDLATLLSAKTFEVYKFFKVFNIEDPLT